jgi:hypothetical protein
MSAADLPLSPEPIATPIATTNNHNSAITFTFRIISRRNHLFSVFDFI